MEGNHVTGAQIKDLIEYLHGSSSHCLLFLIHMQINGTVKRNLSYVSGSFKVLRRTLKDLKIQTLEEKGKNIWREQLVMFMVLKRISFPGQKPKILEHESTGKKQRVSQIQEIMCLAGDFPMASKGIKKFVMECRMDNSCSFFPLSIYLLSSFNNLFIFEENHPLSTHSLCDQRGLMPSFGSRKGLPKSQWLVQKWSHAPIRTNENCV